MDLNDLIGGATAATPSKVDPEVAVMRLMEWEESGMLMFCLGFFVASFIGLVTTTTLDQALANLTAWRDWYRALTAPPVRPHRRRPSCQQRKGRENGDTRAQ